MLLKKRKNSKRKETCICYSKKYKQFKSFLGWERKEESQFYRLTIK
jgi:hypothetical protein